MHSDSAYSCRFNDDHRHNDMDNNGVWLIWRKAYTLDSNEESIFSNIYSLMSAMFGQLRAISSFFDVGCRINNQIALPGLTIRAEDPSATMISHVGNRRHSYRSCPDHNLSSIYVRSGRSGYIYRYQSSPCIPWSILAPRFPQQSLKVSPSSAAFAAHLPLPSSTHSSFTAFTF
jgi:hypothetical protein